MSYVKNSQTQPEEVPSEIEKFESTNEDFEQKGFGDDDVLYPTTEEELPVELEDDNVTQLRLERQKPTDNKKYR